MISSCALLLVAVSQHIGNRLDYEEFHPSLGAVCESDELGPFSAGYFRNSQGDDTIWAAKRKYVRTAATTYGRAFYEYGLVAGYSDYPLLPMARLGYDVMSTRRVGAELFLLPGIEKIAGRTDIFLVLGVQLKIK